MQNSTLHILSTAQVSLTVVATVSDWTARVTLIVLILVSATVGLVTIIALAGAVNRSLQRKACANQQTAPAMFRCLMTLDFLGTTVMWLLVLGLVALIAVYTTWALGAYAGNAVLDVASK